MNAEFVLVGDIGGTHTRFAYAHQASGDGAVELTHFQKFPNDDFYRFEDAIEAFVSREHEDCAGAIFAVAAPIHGDEIQLTNRDWIFSQSHLKSRFGFGQLRLINDFVAMARGVPETTIDGFETLRAGQGKAYSPHLVAGPGTGFGTALLVPRGDDGWIALASEGGHQHFTAITPLEFELRRLIEKKVDFVSLEMISAGKHLRIVYETLCDIYGAEPVAFDHPSELLDLAAKKDEVCLTLCRLRAQATMTALGDAVCLTGALGGVTIAGGVAGRLLDYLKEESSLERFDQRGGHTSYVNNVPINYLTCALAPLRGAGCLMFENVGASVS